MHRLVALESGLRRTGVECRIYARLPNLPYNAITSSVEGRFREAFVMAGRGAAPAGFIRDEALGRRRSHPPGPLRAPARSSLGFGFSVHTRASRDLSAIAGSASRNNEKRGPVPTNAAIGAPEGALDRDTNYGLRFSARHPLRGTFFMPRGAPPRREALSCLPPSPSSCPRRRASSNHRSSWLRMAGVTGSPGQAGR